VSFDDRSAALIDLLEELDENDVGASAVSESTVSDLG
jgi:hypothetical protein